MTYQLHASESELISERGPHEWRALAWIRDPDLTLKKRIGPHNSATLPAAHFWLDQEATKLGFEHFDIVVERLADEGLLVEGTSPDTVEGDLIAPDVDA